ncbi:MAG TPA: ABC transporter substrate binding protein [Burkholderiales bacterium]|nr:ABC transporter substrate binding protein [Burkholderiales bacterium]
MTKRREISRRRLVAKAAITILLYALGWVPLVHAQHISPSIAATQKAAYVFPAQYVSSLVLNDPPTLVKRPDSVKVALNSVQGPIAVIYPDIEEPYRSVFTKIIEGIEVQAKSGLMSYPVGRDFNKQGLLAELRRHNIRVVIALGRHGLKIAKDLDADISVVASGVISEPNPEPRVLSVFSLAPDPALLFEQLKTLTPSIRRIFVVYDPRQNGWLLRLARAAAKSQGIELIAQEAQDLRTAVHHYQDILLNADSKKDALWLPQDSTTVDESAVLPLVLQDSWNRSITVFSSNVSHVRRGALFSLYPNNVELGRNLADSALGFLNLGSQQQRGIMPLKNVLVAVNLRTANHLGLNLSYQQQRSFNLVFPEQ